MKILGPEKQFVYQFGSSNANFNSIFTILSEKHKEKLISECDQPNKELLQTAFAKHCSTMNFNGDSGLTPFMLLSLNCHIQRISPTFYRHSE